MAKILLLNPGRPRKSRKRGKRKPRKNTTAFSPKFQILGKRNKLSGYRVIDSAENQKEKDWMLDGYAQRGLTVKTRPIAYINPKPSAPRRANKGESMKKAKRNPSAMQKTRAIGGRMFGNLNPKNAVKNAVIGQPGMILAQLFAKKFGKDGKSWFEAGWTWENFAWATGGAFVAAVAGNAVMPGKGQIMAEHGLGLVLNKLIQDKFISRSDTLKSALGEYNRLAAMPRANAFLNPSAAQSMRQYDMYGNPIVSSNMNGVILPESRNMGGPVVPVGDLGGTQFTTRTDLGARPYSSAFIRNGSN